MLAVVGDRRVARARREPVQGAALPRAPAVPGGREADRVRAAVEVAPDLEDRDDCRPRCERIRLDFRLVLAAGVAVRVERGAARDGLAVATDAVEAVDRREVVAKAAVDHVADAVDGLELVRAARATDAGGGRHGGGDEHDPDGDDECSLQRLPPGLPSPSAPSRNG